MEKATEQTTQQIERFLKKIAQKFPPRDDASVVTDIHVRVSQGSGEMLAFDDGLLYRCGADAYGYALGTVCISRQPRHS